ncbi:MAG: hypothetical protein FD164_1815, partial [Nitrospirae bacterium]
KPDKFIGCQVSQSAMRSLLIVIKPPLFNDSASMFHAHKPVLIQAFISKPSVGAFNIRIIDRLARANEVQLHSSGIGPFVQSITYELRTMINDYPIRQPSEC